MLYLTSITARIRELYGYFEDLDFLVSYKFTERTEHSINCILEHYIGSSLWTDYNKRSDRLNALVHMWEDYNKLDFYPDHIKDGKLHMLPMLERAYNMTIESYIEKQKIPPSRYLDKNGNIYPSAYEDIFREMMIWKLCFYAGAMRDVLFDYIEKVDDEKINEIKEEFLMPYQIKEEFLMLYQSLHENSAKAIAQSPVAEALMFLTAWMLKKRFANIPAIEAKMDELIKSFDILAHSYNKDESWLYEYVRENTEMSSFAAYAGIYMAMACYYLTQLDISLSNKTFLADEIIIKTHKALRYV